MDSFLTKKKSDPLSIEKVFTSLRKISQTKGNNSNSEKLDILQKMILKAKGEEVKFIVRWV